MPKILWVGLVTLIMCGIALALYWPHFAGTKDASAVEKARNVPYLRPDSTLWQSVLDEILTSDGRVDYTKAAGKQRLALNAYLEQVAKATPDQFESDDQRLAFYLNAYNALVIEGVLKYWPIDSISEAGPFHQFFRERVYTVAYTKVSLHGFETKIIRKYDPLLHFALNCASESCPPLAAKAYSAESLKKQMTAAAQQFINNPERNRYDPDTQAWKLSKIFEWYADDFGGRSGVLALLREHAPGDWQDDVTFTYFDYDWSLNKSH